MKNDARLYVDIHVLQTVPPSCVNRDDTGSPKTAVYGGVTRARVSSQSWKRAMRIMFREQFPEEQLGLRTKKIVGLVAGEIERLARLAAENPDLIKKGPAKEAKEAAAAALRAYPSVDIALFGRMVADDPSLNTDACAQVAHSISTHKISNEYDYFTAVDDLSPEDNAGAAHLGTVEFNSATLYRYATVAVHELQKHLGLDTVDAVKKFVSAFVRSMPDGKQNTFANRTLPNAVLVTVREDQSLNLAGAFEQPVPAGEGGYAAQSAVRLARYAKAVYADFAGEPTASFVTGAALKELAEPYPFTKLLDALGDTLNERIEKGGAVL